MTRDKLKDEAYFDNYLKANISLLGKIEEGLEKAQKEGDKDKEERHFSAKINLEFRLLKALYSAGKPIDEIKRLFEDLLNDFPAFWGEHSSIYDAYDLLALAILFRTGKEELGGIFSLLDSTGRNDALTDFYRKYITEGIVEAKGKTSHGYPYDNLLAIASGGAAVRPLQLKHYLQKDWYKGHKQAFWHNLHKNDAAYFGYWSFEAGAVAKILGIDDGSLKDVPYYPYDLVHYC